MPLINKMLGLLPWISYTGKYAQFGTRSKGWIELYSNGVLTVPDRLNLSCDLYLLSNGRDGTKYQYHSTGSQGGTYYWGELRGNGGQGGTAMEYFSKVLKGDYSVVIGTPTTVGAEFTTTNGTISGGKGGTGRKWEKYGSTGSGGDMTTDLPATAGKDGRIPFTGNTPLTDGLASKKLGAGGSGGEFTGVQAQYNPPYLHRAGVLQEPYPNSGAGGYGSEGPNNNSPGGAGATGIVIVRWGY